MSSWYDAREFRIVANDAVTKALEAKIRAEMQDDKIKGLEGDIAVYRIRAAKMDAWLKAHGVPTEDIYDDL